MPSWYPGFLPPRVKKRAEIYKEIRYRKLKQVHKCGSTQCSLCTSQ